MIHTMYIRKQKKKQKAFIDVHNRFSSPLRLLAIPQKVIRKHKRVKRI